MTDIELLKAIYRVNGDYRERQLEQLANPFTVASLVFKLSQVNESIDAVDRLTKSGHIDCFARVTEAGTQLVKKKFGEVRHLRNWLWLSVGGVVQDGGFETEVDLERRKVKAQARCKVT